MSENEKQIELNQRYTDLAADLGDKTFRLELLTQEINEIKSKLYEIRQEALELQSGEVSSS
jgi:chromosome segregation ATPase